MAILLLFGAVAGLGFVLLRPRWAFVLVTMLFPLKQVIQAYVPSMQGLGNSAVNFAVAGVAGFAVAARFVKGERVIAPAINWTSFSVIALYLLVLVSFAWTPAVEAATRLFVESWPYFVLLLIVLPLLLRDLRDVRPSLTAIMLIGLVLSVFIFLSPATKWLGTRMVLGVLGRSDKAGNPLAIAELGGMLAVIAALMRYDGASRIFDVLRAACFVTGLGLAIASGTRGQVFSAAIVSVLFFPLARPVGNAKQIAVTGIGLAFVGLLIYLAFSRFLGVMNQSRFQAAEMSQGFSDRLLRVMTLGEAWLADPTAWVFGLGANAFSSIMRTTGGIADYVHNTAAEALFEYGLCGGLLYTIGLIGAYRSGFRLWSRVRDDASLRATAAILMGIATYSLLLSFKQGCLLGLPAPFYWWMVVAYIEKSEQTNPMAHTIDKDSYGASGENQSGYGEESSVPEAA